MEWIAVVKRVLPKEWGLSQNVLWRYTRQILARL